MFTFDYYFVFKKTVSTLGYLTSLHQSADKVFFLLVNNAQFIINVAQWEDIYTDGFFFYRGTFKLECEIGVLWMWLWQQNVSGSM